MPKCSRVEATSREPFEVMECAQRHGRHWHRAVILGAIRGLYDPHFSGMANHLLWADCAWYDETSIWTSSHGLRAS